MNIPFFILLVISSVSPVFAQAASTRAAADADWDPAPPSRQDGLAFVIESSAAILLAKDSGFPAAPQFLPSAYFGLSGSFDRGFAIGIGGGILGANDSPIIDGIRYRGFLGMTAGIDAEWFPPGPRQTAERAHGAEGVLLAAPHIGIFARVSGSHVQYDLTRQWFFYPSIRVGILIPLIFPAGGDPDGDNRPGPARDRETILIAPFAEWLIRDDIPLSVSAGASIRFRFGIAPLPTREKP